MHIDPDQRVVFSREAGAEGIGPLVELYRNYLLLLARVEVGRRLQRKIDASDLVQETCLDAYRCFDRFDGTTEAQFLAWLRTILARRVAKTVRHFLGTQGRDIRQELENDLTQSFDQAGQRLTRLAIPQDEHPSQHVMRREQAVILADALQALSPDYREVMILRHWEDLTFPEIAQRMGRSVDSVQKLWIRALARLRTAMESRT